ncbi:Uncharacterised protein [Halioglobus japonicus]|nr:Uncharacterised protein [Halioglobus japonicus]
MNMFGRCTSAISSACKSSRGGSRKRETRLFDHLTNPSNFHAKQLPPSGYGGYTANLGPNVRVDTRVR